MPNRILRDGILSSESVCSLGWAEEVFYRRLHSVADDHGRFHALPKLLRSACYPLQIDQVKDADISAWLSACVRSGLLAIYSAADGKQYVQIVKFGQQVRAKSKFPDPLPASDSTCDQLLANAHLDVGVCGDVCVDGDDKAAAQKPRAATSAVALQTWLDGLNGQDAIPATDTVFDYADKSGIPSDYLALSWAVFKREMRERGKRQKDWRQTYRNAVRGNWFKLWWFDGSECKLTTRGIQEQRAAA